MRRFLLLLALGGVLALGGLLAIRHIAPAALARPPTVPREARLRM